jgi:CheY-like chemotaxis protein
MLLADDSITIQKVVDLTFADEGMQVTTVSNGEQAIEKLEEVAPDIVLADVFMPGRNGYEVCEHIKRNERFRHIPVMLLVGSFEPFDEAEARRVGADDFLTKPFQSIRQLVNKVGALLSGAAEDDATTEDLKLPEAAARAESQKKSAAPTELSMADTAPLPQIKDGAASAQASDAPAGHAQFDDEMIETAPASSFSGADTERLMQPTAPLTASEFEELRVVPQEAKIKQAAEVAPGQMQETVQNFSFEEREASSPQKSEPAPSAPSMAQAVAADEALLDLGDIEPPSAAAAEADDFILDLMDETPVRPSSAPASDTATAAAAAPLVDEMSEETLFDYQEEMVEATPQVEEFAEAQTTIEEQPAELTTTWEPADVEVAGGNTLVEEAAPQMTDPALALQETQGAPSAAALTEWPQAAETSLAETMASPVDGNEPIGTAGSSSSASAASQITLEQLSPEVIEAIARRVVEQLSEKVVEEIAWEVVPQLAELLIKRKLEEEKQ